MHLKTQLIQMQKEDLKKFWLARIQTLTSAILVQRSNQLCQQAK